MSASSPSSPLKNPVLIGVLVVAIAGVVILNMKTFGPRKSAPRRYQAAVMDGPAVPPDLPLLVREVAAATQSRPRTGADHGAAAAALDRDPFVPPRAAKTPVTGTRRTNTTTAARPDPLVCTAVLTRGKQASARINDRFYTVGSKVRGYTVAWVASNGVTLKDKRGKSHFLPLNKESGRNKAFAIQVGSAR